MRKLLLTLSMLVVAISCEKEINDIQNGGKDEKELTRVSIAEFKNAEENSDTWYELTGKVVSIRNTTYGNIYIKDDTGMVYIYGLTDGWCDHNDKSFESIGLKNGDIVTIGTLRGSYAAIPEGGGKDTPAYYISHRQGKTPAVDSWTSIDALKNLKSISYMASGGRLFFTNPAYNASGYLVGYDYEKYFNPTAWDHFLYTYSESQILWTYISDEPDDHETTNYSLTNGLIRSCKTDSYDEHGHLESSEDTFYYYDSQNRLMQIYHRKNRNEFGNETYYDYIYDDGNVVEMRISYVIGGEKNLSYIVTYDYWSNKTLLPPLVITHPLTCETYFYYVDPILLAQGFFGNSFPKNLLKAVREDACFDSDTYNLRTFWYDLDEAGRIWGYECTNEGLLGDYTDSYIFDWR